MKIVVNTHIKNKIAVDHLLESMKANEEFREFDILIMVGGYYELSDYEIHTTENVTYIYCNHNSIDFTGMITLLELYSHNIDEYYFYLHDTCKVGVAFYKKLKNINAMIIERMQQDKCMTTMKINKPFSMNIGIYSQAIINVFHDFLLSCKNTDEIKCITYKTLDTEDYIFKHDENCIVIDEHDSCERSSPIDYYKTGTMRVVEYYSNMDLCKIKANWGQGQCLLEL